MKTGDRVLVSGLHFAGEWPGTVVDIRAVGKIHGREWQEASVELDCSPGRAILCAAAVDGDDFEIPARWWQIAKPMPVADEPAIAARNPTVRIDGEILDVR